MKEYNVRYGIVVQCVDKKGNGEIKVRLGNGDTEIPDSETRPAYPALPLMTHVIPQKGEMVTLFVSSQDSNDESPLYYLGPIVNAPENLASCQAPESLDNRDSSPVQEKNDYTKEERGILYSESDDISLYGRKNSDMILGNKALALRYKVRSRKDNTDVFNMDTPSAVILNDVGVNVIGDKINLIGNHSANGNTLFKEKNKYLAKETAYESFAKGETAHPVPFGNELVSILQTMADAIAEHKHNMTGKSPDDGPAIVKLKEEIQNLSDKLLSNNVFIN